MSSDQLVAAPKPSLVSRSNSAIRSMLLHLVGTANQGRRIEDALAIARASSAHLSCLHVTPAEAQFGFDTFGGAYIMPDVVEALEEQEALLRTAVEAELRNEDVSWDYRQLTGSVIPTLLRFSGLSDLIVTARNAGNTEYVGSSLGFIGDLVTRSRVPVFVSAVEGPALNPTGTALIAWDGSDEAANAVRSAVGLLSLAGDVRVLTVPEGHVEKRRSFPATDVLEYLSRHGIHAELEIEKLRGRNPDAESVAGIIADEAQGMNAAYVVMGAYGHSRFGEFMFGGVTRYMLANYPSAMLLAH